MSIANVKRGVVSILGLLGLVLVVTSVQAQGASSWKTVCRDAKKPETCKIQQTLFMQKKVDGNSSKIIQPCPEDRTP